MSATKTLLPPAARWVLALQLSFATSNSVIAADAARPLSTLVDLDCYHAATYGSFNSKIVAVGSRWFMPYRIGESEAGAFRLMMSEDSGRTWALAYADDQPSYQCPSMVADDRGRLFLTVTYLGKARLLRISRDARGAYHRKFVKEFCSAGPKSVLSYDAKSGRVYACGTDAKRAPTLALVSDDGMSWKIAGAIGNMHLTSPYAQTTCPQVAPDGRVLSALTDVITLAADSARTRKGVLWFCSFPTARETGQ